MVFGIPDEALMGAAGAMVLLVVVLKATGKKKPSGAPNTKEPEAEGVSADRHTGIEDLIGKPAELGLPSPETLEEEEEAGMSVETNSLESLMARPIDEAPSLGDDSKTNVKTGIDMMMLREKEAEILPKEVPPKPKAKTPQKRAHDLMRLREQFGEEFDVDDLGDLIAVPEERARYEPPEDIKNRADEETSKERSAKLYDKPSKERAENMKRYCMLQFDKGENAMKVENLLRVKGVNRKEAKQLSFRMYHIWIEKREPLIREIKEVRDMIKRVEYKYLKRQIDGPSRNKMINDSNRKIVELEAKLKSSEDYFC